MLKKILKYDMKKILKFLSIFYSLALFFAILTRIFLSVDNSLVANIIGQICSGIVIAMIFNIIINNLMRCWVIFSGSIYGDESYLTHTLPVSKKTLYLSKFLLALITMLISVCVITLTLFIAYYSKENILVLKNVLLPIAEIYNSTVFSFVTVIILIFFLELLNLLQSGYTGLILGHKMNNNKIGFSILYGFIAYTITQIFMLIVIFITALLNKDMMNLFVTNTVINLDMIKLIVVIGIIIYSVSIIAYYIFNYKQIKKGVNVD